MRWAIRILMVLLFAALPAAAQQTGPKFALVIGNADYAVPAWKLSNPVRDADLMAQRLRAVGFEVEVVRNGTRAQMEQAFERFSFRLQQGGPSAVSVFYYSGHGAEEGAVNYLIPVDADIRTKEQLRFRAPSAQLVLDEMGQAGNAVNIMILDACRDLTLADSGKGLTRGGLAEIRQTPNVFIAYATAPNQTADDGAGANSPFTTALADALSTEATAPIALLFEDVNARVRSATGGAQQPRYSNGLPIPRWSFAAATPAIVSQPDPELERLRRENEALRSAQRSGAGTTPSPSRSMPVVAVPGAGTPPSPQKLPAQNAGEVARAPGTVFRDCADVCPEMVVIPPGKIQVDWNSRSVVQYTVSSVAVGRFEVTFDEWDACVRSGGCASNKTPSDEGWGRGRRPVINVSWADAQEYIGWISGFTGKHYRLLTGPEWLYAARGGSTGKHSWGETESNCSPQSQSGANLGCEPRRTFPVGRFLPNIFGLYDVDGNVSEYTQTCQFPGSNAPAEHLVYDRCDVSNTWGGDWSQREKRTEDTLDHYGWDSRYKTVGFRVARSL